MLPKDKGYSLIEVLFALLVIAIVSAALVPLIGGSVAGIFYSGDRSRALLDRQGEMDAKIAGKVAYEAASMPIRFGSSPTRNIAGGVVEAGNLKTFMARIPTMSLNPPYLLEGYPQQTIEATGVNTDFAGATQLVIKNNRGQDVNPPTTYSRTVVNRNLVRITLGTGLTNADGPYEVSLRTRIGPDLQIARALLGIVLPAYVAVGNNGTIIVSDGVFSGGGQIHWQTRTSGTTQHLNGVTWGKDMFVAVGDNGTILTSASGVRWTARVSGTGNNLRGVAFGRPAGQEEDGVFVVVGDGGTVLTSTDGVTWTSRHSSGPHLNGVTFGVTEAGNRLFVAVGHGGTVLTSPQAIHWTGPVLPAGDTLNGVTFGILGSSPETAFSRFVVVGQALGTGEADGIVYTSADGQIWSGPVVVGGSQSRPIYGVGWGGRADGSGVFVAVGAGHGGRARIATWSGGAWDTRDFDGEGSYRSVVWSDSRFIAVGDGGRIRTSQDAVSWTSQTSGTGAQLNGITMRGSVLPF